MRSIPLFLLSILFITTFSNSEKAGKFAWKGSLKSIDNTTLNVPHGTVAMSEYVYVSNSLSQLILKDPCSIVFMIDNSGTNSDTDPTGQRFQVIRELLDEIHAKAPETRVGLSIFGGRMWFYKPDNPDLFVSVPVDNYMGGNGCVIPPLDLNKMYSGKAAGFPTGTISYNKTGIDLIKMYLQSHPGAFTPQLDYTPTHKGDSPIAIRHLDQSTNITIAFEGAKLAHLSQNPALKKNRHFNIFFSDGAANFNPADPTQGTVDDYIKGINVPTTLTVFYKTNSSDFAKLQTMNTNIKNNGYSDKNKPLTDILNLNNWETIKQKLKDFFNQILTNTTGTPVQITIGTSISTMWDSTGFLYKDMFPLQIGPTPFSLDIKVHLKRDSLNDLGQIISTVESDTFLKYAFKVAVAPDAAVPDSMVMKWWERSIGWYNNGTAITALSSEMTDLEMRFTYGRIDTLYNYPEAIVEVWTTKSKDHEKITLDKGATFFSKKVPHKTGTGVIDNGTLEHAGGDSIIAVFRNKPLPLDTMRIVMPYTEGNLFSLDHGALYDMNADGKVDKVTIGLKGNRIADFALSMADTIANRFPPLRILTVVGTPVAGDAGLTYTVTEGAPAILTATTPDDTVSIVKDTVFFPNQVFLLKSKITLVDSMAPVIMSARFIEGNGTSIEGKLSVIFSEDIAQTNAAQPFEFFRNTNSIYRISSKHVSTNGKSAQFTIAESDFLDDSIPRYGDSIRILATAGYADKIGIVQDNPKNIRRPLSIIKSVQMVKAWYTETDAQPDGLIDIVGIEFNLDLTPARAKSIADAITFTNKRALVYDKIYTVDGKNLLLQVTESGTPRTSVDPSYDVVTVSQVTMDSITLYPQIIPAEDRLAPIALQGIYTPYSGEALDPDMLEVAFSEDIKTVTAAEPFIFYDYSTKKEYVLTLNPVSTTGSKATFRVTGGNDVCPVTGDSLWIKPANNQGGFVNDLVGLTQSVKHKPAPLIANPYPYIYNLMVYPNPYEKSGSINEILTNKIKPKYLIPQTGLRSIELLENSMLFLAAPHGRTPPGIDVSATVSVYDALGNLIIAGAEAELNKSKSTLYYIWNNDKNSGPTNINGKPIGKGTYLLVFVINDAQKGKTVMKKTIGIK